MNRVDKFYLIYDLEDPNKDLFAWSHNKDHADLFIAMRKKGRFKLVCKKKKIKNSVDEFTYGRWKNDHKGKMLTMSYLGQEQPFIEFPVTYHEDFSVGEECDKMYDELFRLAAELCKIPFTEEIIEAIQYTAEVARNRKNVSFDTFKVFMKLFGDTVL